MFRYTFVLRDTCSAACQEILASDDRASHCCRNGVPLALGNSNVIAYVIAQGLFLQVKLETCGRFGNWKVLMKDILFMFSTCLLK